MALLLGDVSDGFVNDRVIWYDLMSELVDNINGYMLIDTGGVIWLSEVWLLLGGNENATINSFLRNVIGPISFIYWFLEFFLARKVAETYALGGENWSLSLSIADIAKCLANSGPKRQVRASTSDIIRSGLWITVKWYSSSSCAQIQKWEY